MRNPFMRIFALLLVLTMLVGLLPTIAFADPAAKKQNDGKEPQPVANGSVDEIWKAINTLEDEEVVAVRGKSASADSYAKLVDDVIAIVEASDDYKEGTIERHGDFFFWETKDGRANGYSPRLRAQMRQTGKADADPKAYAGIETVSFADKGGGPSSTNVAVFQPYFGIDTNFTTQYKTEGESIAAAAGGTSTTYLTTDATIDNIAKAIQNCGVVIFDSHGDTDYYVSGSKDYVTKANTSYLCLQTDTGFTSDDEAWVQGTYGQYKHAYYAGSYGNMKYYCVDGTAIANHMTGNACHNLVWMAICLGMATTGLHVPLRNKGVEVVFGYSQSVSFSGDYQYEEDFWTKMKNGEDVAAAFAYMTRTKKWDYYSSYNTYAKARYNYCAFPNIVSSEDDYQGHRTKNPSSASDSTANNNHDSDYGACNCQSVSSTWTLTGPTITLNSIGILCCGKSYDITGSVTSATKLTSVKGEILSGSTVKQSYTVYPNAKTLNLKTSDINTNLKFEDLAVGSYTLRITAVNAKSTGVKNVSFNVAAAIPTISLDSIGTVTYGSSHNITGTVSSSVNLTSVKGEILSGSTVKQSYTVYPNAKTLDLKSSAINTNLKFGTLAVGSYTLKITAVNSTGTSTKSVSFTIASTGTKPAITLDSIGNVTQGSSHNITGTVSSTTNLTSVKGEILSGTTVKQSYTVYPNAKTLDLKSSAINTNLKFGTLAVGSYTLKITAVNSAGTTTKSVDFKIITNGTVPAITLNSIGTVTYGNSYNITGTVSSSTNLTSVKGEILSGTTVKQSYTVKPNAKTLDLKSSAINTNLKFGTLAVGSYTLKITAVNAAGTATKSVSFTVSTNLTISVDAIGNVSYGSSHNITGTVSSAAKLTSVKGEILSGSTVKQSVTVTPNAKTLNLKTSNINKNLKFGTLAKGTYTLRITAKDATGTTKTVSITFKIV